MVALLPLPLPLLPPLPLLLLLLLRRGKASSRDVKMEDCARAREGGEGVDVGWGVGCTEEEGGSVATAGAVGPALDVAVLPRPAWLMLGVPDAPLALAAVPVPESVRVRAGAGEALGRGVGVAPTGAEAVPEGDAAAEAEGKSGEGKAVPVDEAQVLPLAERMGEVLAVGLRVSGRVAGAVGLADALRLPRCAAAVTVPAPSTAVLLPMPVVDALLRAEPLAEALGVMLCECSAVGLPLTKAVGLGSGDVEREALARAVPVAMPAAALGEGSAEGMGVLDTLPVMDTEGLSRAEVLALRETRGERDEVGDTAPGVRERAGVSEMVREGVGVGDALGAVGEEEGVEASPPPAGLWGVPVAARVKSELRVACTAEAVGAAMVAEGKAVSEREGVGEGVSAGGLGVGALPLAVPRGSDADGNMDALGKGDAVSPEAVAAPLAVGAPPA